MKQESRCPIWDTPASGEYLSHKNVTRIDSPRAGGEYIISGEAIERLPQLDERGKVRLTTWLVRSTQIGRQMS